MFGVLALLTPVACGSDNKNPAPATGAGGNTTAGGGGGSNGGGGRGGNSGSAGITGTAPDGGGRTEVMLPPVMESGMATAKFCNPLSANNMSVEFTLEIGTNKVQIKASSGQCTPIKGMPCTAIPAGTIPVRLLVEGEPVLEGVWGPIMPNTETLFLTTLDAQNFPDLEGGTFRAEVKCNTVDFDTIFGGPDGGAGSDAGSDGGTRPPRTPKIHTDWSRFANLESIGLKPTARRAQLGGWQANRP